MLPCLEGSGCDEMRSSAVYTDSLVLLRAGLGREANIILSDSTSCGRLAPTGAEERIVARRVGCFRLATPFFSSLSYALPVGEQ